MTPQEELAALRRLAELEAKAGAEKINQSEASGLFDAFTQGATLGFGDEATGFEAGMLGRTPEGGWFDYSGSFEDRYRAARDAERAQQKEYGKQSPGLATTAEIAGAITSPVNKFIAPMMAAPSLLGRTWRGAAVGAGTGAAAGVGGAENLSDAPMDAVKGAALGGAVGGVAPAAIEGITKLGSPVLNAFLDRLPYRQKSAAARRIAQAIQDEGLTPEQAVQKVQSLGPEAGLMDIGENLQGQARAVHSIPGEGRSMIGKFLSGRQEGARDAGGVMQGGQHRRVQDVLEGAQVPEYYATRQGTQTARKRLGKEYEAARQLDEYVDIEPMLNDLSRGIEQSKGGVQSTLKKVQSLLVDATGKPEIDIGSLHQAKMAIDDLMTGEGRSSMGNVSKGLIRKYQNQLVEAIENSGPAGEKYRAGRLGTAGQWRIDDAAEQGSKFMLGGTFKNSKELSSYVKELNPDEVEAFKSGVVRHLMNKLESVQFGGDSVKQILGKPGIEDKLRLVFGPKEFKRIVDDLTKEQQLYSTYNMVRGGSPTARIEAEKASIMQDPGRLAQGFRGLVSGNLGQMAKGAFDVVGGAMDRAQLPRGVSKEMAEILMGRGDLSQLQQQAIRAQMGQNTKQNLSRAALLSALTGVQ